MIKWKDGRTKKNLIGKRMMAVILSSAMLTSHMSAYATEYPGGVH